MPSSKRQPHGHLIDDQPRLAPARSRRPCSCECTYMKSTSESLSHPETSNGRAAGGNCVVVRRGGEQPEADLRSQTKVNPIRFATAASLLASGEACGQSHNRFLSQTSYKGEKRAVGDGWGENARKVTYGSVETCAGRNPFRRDRAGVRAAIVAKKRGNSRGAKGGRKRNHMGQLDPFKKHNRLLNELKLCGQTSLGEAKAILWCVGTARAGEGNPASLQSLWSGVRRNSGNRGVGKFATGEPDAGDPQVRFGGGSETNQCLVPTSIKLKRRAKVQNLIDIGISCGLKNVCELFSRRVLFLNLVPSGDEIQKTLRGQKMECRNAPVVVGVSGAGGHAGISLHVFRKTGLPGLPGCDAPGGLKCLFGVAVVSQCLD